MDKSKLAEKMLEWEKLKADLDEIENEIRKDVLEMGKTFEVGNVRASYSGGRRVLNYATTGKHAPKEIIEAFTVVSERVDYVSLFTEFPAPEELVKKHTIRLEDTDWAAVCKEAKIDPEVLSQSAPSVTIKLV